MRYQSTRNLQNFFTASEVITRGIAEDGGLFVPVSFPDVKEDLRDWAKLSYHDLATQILTLYLTDFSTEEIENCVTKAYQPQKFGATGNVDEVFDKASPVKIVPFSNSPVNILELWHGPTCAFKDMALQMLPHLLTTSIRKTSPDKTAIILVATSGDTGKAALEGFKNVSGTKIISFYPRDGVSDMQKLQMCTQEGENLSVCAVDGNFDDTQTGVKKIFTDTVFCATIKEKGMLFSSANSINFGRLLPQIIYYFYSYLSLYRDGNLQSLDTPVNFVVPTGNFGNILAAYYAYRMGIPVNKFICASNANHILTDFINTGVYDRRRDFHTTISPSMDILISSNLERLLYAMSGNDTEQIANWMNSLGETGVYEVDAKTKEKLQEKFIAGFCGDVETKEEISITLQEENYLCDTHTAVAVSVYEKYRADSNDQTPTVIVSTANPYKFPGSVLDALGGDLLSDEFANAEALFAKTKVEIPWQILSLKDKSVRFKDEILANEMPNFVQSTIDSFQRS